MAVPKKKKSCAKVKNRKFVWKKKVCLNNKTIKTLQISKLFLD
uniref:Ribosomal protein L32 n=1 Tax=Colponema vietnamica TaxID=1492817 RepID=V5KVG2_9ALVE|nr:ribosomal protein L32 [Colponema vietnamica]ATY40852.1 ribosomal protein L32 [Colponema vietnamica]